MNKCPCKGCTKRKLGCHGFCDQYKEWRDWRDEVNRKRHAEDETKQLSRDHELKYRKNLKQGRKKGG